MSDRKILKWSIPVDDEWHPVGGGDVVLVACRTLADMVEIWTDEPGAAEAIPPRAARVYGTGHALPPDVHAVGSVLSPSGHLVWHVMRTRERIQ